MARSDRMLTKSKFARSGPTQNAPRSRKESLRDQWVTKLDANGEALDKSKISEILEKLRNFVAAAGQMRAPARDRSPCLLCINAMKFIASIEDWADTSRKTSSIQSLIDRGTVTCTGSTRIVLEGCSHK